jgi:selenocysteine lyase/cysteine desulfurase
MDVRSKFLIPNSLYFLNHSVGCLPRNSRMAAERFFFSWQNFGGEAWESWFENIERFKNGLAKLIGANNSAEICPQVNVSAGISKIVSSLPIRSKRKKILISESAFPSVGFALEMAGIDEYELEFIPEDICYEAILSSWESRLRDDVQAVLITHVLSNTSLCYPVKEIVEIAKAKNIFTLVDAAASVGVIPINVSDWNADFVVGTCLKWLCGGSGTGFLWVNEQQVGQFYPKEVGWFSHKDPSELNIHNFEYADDSRRYLGGTPSILPYVIAAESIQVLLNIGINTIFAHNKFLVDKILNGLRHMDIVINSPMNRNHRGGTVVVELPDMAKAKTYFSDKALWVDQRSHGFRMSPHIYNEAVEIEEILQVIEDLWSKKVTVVLPEKFKARRFGSV